MDDIILLISIIMIKTQITISNTLGLHARPSMKLAELCSKFNAEIYIKKDGKKINAKNMMDILMLASGYRSQIEILVDGDDEKIAVKEIKSLFSDRFGEES